MAAEVSTIGLDSVTNSLFLPSEANWRFSHPLRRRHIMGSPVTAQSVDETVPAVLGESSPGEGVRGLSHSIHHAGVVGINDNTTPENTFGMGVFGVSSGFNGVHGVSHASAHAGVAGTHDKGGDGVFGQSDTGHGVIGF